MDIAIVTAADTRIGQAVSKKLIDIGCRVYGLGTHFDNTPLNHTDFVAVTCDITNTAHLCQITSEILEKEKNIYALVNLARHLNPGACDTLELNEIETLVQTNIMAPMLLTRLVLPALTPLQGYVINIGYPTSTQSEQAGSAFLATEKAMEVFTDQLVAELRGKKVKVCSLELDTANAEEFFKQGYTEQHNDDLILSTEAVAQAIEYIVSQKTASVVSRLQVRAQRKDPTTEDKKGSVTRIAAAKAYEPKEPSKKVVVARYKKPAVKTAAQKIPATYMDMAREAEKEAKAHIEDIEREKDEIAEEEKFDREFAEEEKRPRPARKQPQRGNRNSQNRNQRKPQDRPEGKPQSDRPELKEGDQPSKNRRRRSRGRNRNNQNRDQQPQEQKDNKPTENKENRPKQQPRPSQDRKPRKDRPARDSRHEDKRKPEQEAAPVKKQASRRNRRTTERPNYNEPQSTTVYTPSAPTQPLRKSPVSEKQQPDRTSQKDPIKKVAAKKRVAKKTVPKPEKASKPVKKVATKKAPSKKVAAKKVPAKKTAKKAVKKVAAKKAVTKKVAAKKAARKTARKKTES